MTKGYSKVVGAKLSHVVDETFYSIPTDGANYRYLVRLIFGASTEQREPAKKRDLVVVC